MNVVYVLFKQKPKSRTRIGKTKNGRIYLFTPRQHQPYERAIKEAAKRQCRECMTCPISVDIVFQSPKKLRGDLDNYVKCVLDALQGVAFKNDRQIDKLTAFRRKGDDYLTKVVVKKTKIFNY